MMSRSSRRTVVVFVSGLVASAAFAQGSNPVVKPPVSQAWIDIATFSGMGMPMGMPPGGGPGAANPMAAIGGRFGGGGGGGTKAGGNNNSFGQTQGMSAGRWVDVTLSTRNNPALTEAQQAVPAGFMPSPALKLLAPREVKSAAPDPDDEKVVEPKVERPKGRLLLYWGCGAAIRPGQPKVLDMASASSADMANFFVSRGETKRGAHQAAGRPVWPSLDDARMVPPGASLVGEHAFSGAGVPEGFRFQIPAAQDVMPPLQVRQADQGGATELSWGALPTARAYFIAGMGAAQKDEMVIWTSSELPDTGFGLLDYQTNSAVDRWLREKVLLQPSTTQCTVPKGVFPGQGGMLRVIAYGSELNLAHPPRPADPKAVWEPVWAVKLRVKSMAMVIPGMPSMPDARETGAPRGAETSPPAQQEPAKKEVNPMDLLKGILGR